MPQPRRHGPHVGHVLDPFNRRIVHFEGRAEKRNIVALLASPDVAEIREQQSIDYVNRAGRRATHTLDLLVILNDGTRRACSVKPEDRADAHIEEFGQVVRGVCGFEADEFVILTDWDVSDVEFANATAILHSASLHDVAGQNQVRECAARLPGRVSLADVARASRLGERGYRAALVLLKTGELAFDGVDEISPRLQVENRLNQPVY